MYNPKFWKHCRNITVKQFCEYLQNNIPPEAVMYICGDNQVYMHLEEDGSAFTIDHDSLSDLPEYEGYEAEELHLEEDREMYDTDIRKEIEAMDNIYEILVENFMEERLDDFALEDEGFCQENKKFEESLKKYHDLQLPKEETEVIDHAFDMYAAQSTKYAELAYRQGMKDVVRLLKAIGLFERV